jgi:hypothetical protein
LENFILSWNADCSYCLLNVANLSRSAMISHYQIKSITPKCV